MAAKAPTIKKALRTVAKNLHAVRRRSKTSNKAFAAKVGVSTGTLKRIEVAATTKREYAPSSRTLLKFAVVGGVGLDGLSGGYVASAWRDQDTQGRLFE